VRSIEGLRGAAIVTRGGRVTLEAAGGLADASPGVPCTPRTRFQIASVSKQFTAVAVMLLAESGRLDLAERVALVLQAPLLTEPGTRWQYSSLGYVLAGYIVAQASGQPYPSFLAERVMVPLGLTETSSGDVPSSGAARGYRDGQPVGPWPLSAMAGTGLPQATWRASPPGCIPDHCSASAPSRK
jgi:CubicO group peptidase (beta-lactamase class C family)